MNSSKRPLAESDIWFDESMFNDNKKMNGRQSRPSGISGSTHETPDCASLHPGYGFLP
jgi:hypothetical protein